jgi:very-short-patch-repair endonuclease
MCDRLDRPDVLVAGIASEQHGVVSVAQLRAAGLDKHQVRHRMRTGHLHRVHRGVYAVGHRGFGWERRWMAAVLASGDDAALSHGSAAALWGLLRPVSGPIDVSVPTSAGRVARAGIRLYRRKSLQAGHLTKRRRIPVTTPARTIEDIEGNLAPWLVRRAIRQAEIAGFPLGAATETDGTRSDLERDFLRLCRLYDVPAPEVNVKVGRWTVDFIWRRERVVVETDSYDYHRGRVAFRDDHARDLELRRRGFAIRRYSEHQVSAQPAQVAADLRDALALSS